LAAAIAESSFSPGINLLVARRIKKIFGALVRSQRFSDAHNKNVLEIPM
jgi:hypothetical protein